MAVTQYAGNHVSLAGCLLIILLAADFFIPMRQLGSFFHIAMNGMAASDKDFPAAGFGGSRAERNENSGRLRACLFRPAVFLRTGQRDPPWHRYGLPLRAALRLWLGRAAAGNPPPLSSMGRNKGIRRFGHSGRNRAK